jgi:hypothetical protein
VESVTDSNIGPVVLYTDIPFLTRFIRCLGHVGITNWNRTKYFEVRAWPFFPTTNSIWILEGLQDISRPILFGKPTLYLPLQIPPQYAHLYDYSLEVTAVRWSTKAHKGVLSNCHSFICDVLNTMHHLTGGKGNPFTFLGLGLAVFSYGIPITQNLRHYPTFLHRLQSDFKKLYMSIIESGIGINLALQPTARRQLNRFEGQVTLPQSLHRLVEACVLQLYTPIELYSPTSLGCFEFSESPNSVLNTLVNLENGWYLRNAQANSIQNISYIDENGTTKPNHNDEYLFSPLSPRHLLDFQSLAQHILTLRHRDQYLITATRPQPGSTGANPPPHTYHPPILTPNSSAQQTLVDLSFYMNKQLEINDTNLSDRIQSRTPTKQGSNPFVALRHAVKWAQKFNASTEESVRYLQHYYQKKSLRMKKKMQKKLQQDIPNSPYKNKLDSGYTQIVDDSSDSSDDDYNEYYDSSSRPNYVSPQAAKTTNLDMILFSPLSSSTQQPLFPHYYQHSKPLPIIPQQPTKSHRKRLLAKPPQTVTTPQRILKSSKYNHYPFQKPRLSPKHHQPLNPLNKTYVLSTTPVPIKPYPISSTFNDNAKLMGPLQLAQQYQAIQPISLFSPMVQETVFTPSKNAQTHAYTMINTPASSSNLIVEVKHSPLRRLSDSPIQNHPTHPIDCLPSPSTLSISPTMSSLSISTQISTLFPPKQGQTHYPILILTTPRRTQPHTPQNSHIRKHHHNTHRSMVSSPFNGTNQPNSSRKIRKAPYWVSFGHHNTMQISHSLHKLYESLLPYSLYNYRTSHGDVTDTSVMLAPSMMDSHGKIIKNTTTLYQQNPITNILVPTLLPIQATEWQTIASFKNKMETVFKTSKQQLKQFKQTVMLQTQHSSLFSVPCQLPNIVTPTPDHLGVHQRIVPAVREAPPPASPSTTWAFPTISPHQSPLQSKMGQKTIYDQKNSPFQLQSLFVPILRTHQRPRQHLTHPVDTVTTKAPRDMKRPSSSTQLEPPQNFPLQTPHVQYQVYNPKQDQSQYFIQDSAGSDAESPRACNQILSPLYELEGSEQSSAPNNPTPNTPHQLNHVLDVPTEGDAILSVSPKNTSLHHSIPNFQPYPISTTETNPEIPFHYQLLATLINTWCFFTGFKRQLYRPYRVDPDNSHKGAEHYSIDGNDIQKINHFDRKGTFEHSYGNNHHTSPSTLHYHVSDQFENYYKAQRLSYLVQHAHRVEVETRKREAITRGNGQGALGALGADNAFLGADSCEPHALSISQQLYQELSARFGFMSLIFDGFVMVESYLQIYIIKLNQFCQGVLARVNRLPVLSGILTVGIKAVELICPTRFLNNSAISQNQLGSNPRTNPSKVQLENDRVEFRQESHHFSVNTCEDDDISLLDLFHFNISLLIYYTFIIPMFWFNIGLSCSIAWLELGVLFLMLTVDWTVRVCWVVFHTLIKPEFTSPNFAAQTQPPVNHAIAKPSQTTDRDPNRRHVSNQDYDNSNVLLSSSLQSSHEISRLFKNPIVLLGQYVLFQVGLLRRPSILHNDSTNAIITFKSKSYNFPDYLQADESTNVGIVGTLIAYLSHFFHVPFPHAPLHPRIHVQNTRQLIFTLQQQQSQRLKLDFSPGFRNNFSGDQSPASLSGILGELPPLPSPFIQNHTQNIPRKSTIPNDNSVIHPDKNPDEQLPMNRLLPTGFSESSYAELA